MPLELADREMSYSELDLNYQGFGGFTRQSLLRYGAVLLAVSFSVLLFIVRAPVSAFKLSLIMVFAALALPDRIGGLFCVLLVPAAGVALSLIDIKAGFQFDILAFGLWAVSMVVHGVGPLRNLKLSLLDKLILAYVVGGLIYMFLSPSLSLGYQGFKFNYRAFLAYFLVRIGGSDLDDFWRVTRFILLMMVLVFSDAIYRYFFDYMSTYYFLYDRASNPVIAQSLASYYGMAAGSAPRLTSIWMFSTGLGPFLVVGILFIFGMQDFLSRKLTRIGWLVLLLCFIAGVVLSYSRSAWMGILISVLTIVVLSSRRVSKALIVVMIVTILAVLLYILLPDQVRVFVDERISNLWTGDVESGGHFYYLLVGVSNLVQYPLGKGLGVGFAQEVGKISGAIWNESTYLKVGQEMGVLPMILFISILIVMVVYMKKAHDSVGSPLLKAFFRVAIAASVMNLAINITLPIWESATTYLMVFSAAYASNILRSGKRTNPTNQ